MSAEKYLQMIQRDIHSVVFATTDEKHFPVTCVIDIMLSDKDGLYFLTAIGKAFYKRLKNQPIVSITGMKGTDTLSVNLLPSVEKYGKSGRNGYQKYFRKTLTWKPFTPTRKAVLH